MKEVEPHCHLKVNVNYLGMQTMFTQQEEIGKVLVISFFPFFSFSKFFYYNIASFASSLLSFYQVIKTVKFFSTTECFENVRPFKALFLQEKNWSEKGLHLQTEVFTNPLES